MTKKALIVSCLSYNSPVQVGDHHFARFLVNRGWKVAFISDPITPFHFLKGLTPELRDRLDNCRSGGRWEHDGMLWSYVPASLVMPYNVAFLKRPWIYENWQKTTMPDLVEYVREKGFGTIDIIYFRTPKQNFWLRDIEYRMALYRIADKDSGFFDYNDEVWNRELQLAKSVDLVIFSAQKLKLYVEDMNPKKMLYLPNGVDFRHFRSGSRTVPVEYDGVKNPIAVYVGSMEEWFDFDLINYAVKSLPSVTFVVIGPDKLARRKLDQHSNLLILGRRSFSEIPAYLHNADVGLIPFNVRRFPDLINSVNPLKLYEYMACGLPVVSVKWEELEKLNSPARLAETADDFVNEIKGVLGTKQDNEVYVQYAERADWANRFKRLEEIMDVDLAMM